MSGPRTKSHYVAAVSGVLCLLALAEPAAAQDVGVTETGVSPVVAAASGMVLTLVVGGVLITRYQDFTEGIVNTMRRKLLWSFLLGLIPFAVVLAAVVVVPPLGVLLLLPYILLGVVFTPISYIAVGRVFALSWRGSLLVAVVFAGLVTVVPIIGQLVGFIVATIAVGAYFVRYGGPDTRESNRRPT
jgi:MFS family permease